MKLKIRQLKITENQFFFLVGSFLGTSAFRNCIYFSSDVRFAQSEEKKRSFWLGSLWGYKMGADGFVMLRRAVYKYFFRPFI